jgi:hypothetical protein
MADKEKRAGLIERLAGRLQARKPRAAERARLKAELQRDRVAKEAAVRKSFEGGGG